MTCGITCMIIMLLPFMICDFIFAGGDSTCLTQDLKNSSITINLKQWLLTDAWVVVVLIIILLLILVITCVSPAAGLVAMGGFLCIAILYSLYKIAWLIIGSVMFWGELNPDGTCQKPLNDYMWVKLILGLIGVICNCGSFPQTINSMQTKQ